MNKNIEIFFPFAENRNASILVVVQIFVTMREMTLEEGKYVSQKFHRAEDLILPICEANLAGIEKLLKSFDYNYKVVYMEA